MCGFAGLLSRPSRPTDVLLQSVERMIGPISHRGPDDSGRWVDAENGVGLGFRRLAIIDLSELGHQPMHSATGRFIMVFNGEVYNFLELRRELEQSGARFRGGSDSEVILAAFERWGVERSLPRFLGMFAIAVWDAQERSLSLARDRFGKKPLYIYAEPGLVTFGSEIKALVAGPAFDRAIDPDALELYMRYMYIPAPHTIYRRVRKLMPAHVLRITDANAALPPSIPYWSAEDAAERGARDPFTGDDSEAVAEGTRLITDAARLRMIADVPLGAFLSGGIDSSTVVSLMSTIANRPIRTFSIAFDEADYDEGAHAARVAKHLGTDHSEIRLTADSALDLVPSIADWFDEPLADPSLLPTYLICREARREVTVAVSGDGGDEVFGGYNRYVAGAASIERAMAMPRPVRELTAAAISSASSSAWDRAYGAMAWTMPARARVRLPGEKLHKLANLLRADSPARMYRSLLSAWQEPTRVVRGGHGVESALERVFHEHPGLGLVERMMLADQVEYLPDDLLAKVDRTSMAVSLEVRVPLLDHRVAEFAWRLPRRFKIRGGETKWLLRQILYQHVPREMVDRPKMGFSVPIDRWLRGPLRNWAEDHLTRDRIASSGMLEVEPVRRVWAEFIGGSTTAAHAVWSVLVFQAWYERWGGART